MTTKTRRAPGGLVATAREVADAVARTQSRRSPREWAFAFQSGQVGFGPTIPAGALPLGSMPDDFSREIVAGLARRAYDDTLLVPGVPEARDGTAAYDAFMTWRRRLLDAGRKERLISEAQALVAGEVAPLEGLLDHIRRLDAEVRRLRELIYQSPNP